ncbi:MAG: tyrosine-type recombinase/integrase [Egibacteraceae bacterium]
MIRIRHGKGGRTRTVDIDPSSCAIVQRWLDLRRRRGMRSPALFCTLGGRPLQPRCVRAMLSRYATRAGVDKRVHPHGLRHTHAGELAAEGVPVNVIQAQLGHASLKTTSVYLPRSSPVSASEGGSRDRTPGIRSDRPSLPQHSRTGTVNRPPGSRCGSSGSAPETSIADPLGASADEPRPPKGPAVHNRTTRM